MQKDMSNKNAGLRLTAHLTVSILINLLLFWMFTSLSIAQTPTPETSAPLTNFEPGPPITHTLIGRTNCLICHAEGFQQAGIIPDDHKGYVNEECRDCHEPTIDSSVIEILVPEGTIPNPLSHPPSDGLNSCYDCHILLDEEKHIEISEIWEVSVHGKAEIGCVECHGGDARTDEMNLSMAEESGFVGVPTRAMVPSICGGCHADVERMGQYNLPTDQYIKYADSVHGKKLMTDRDTRVALCTDCHGSHDVKSPGDPTAAAYPLNIPELCASCHSDKQLMEPYGIPTNQFETYEKSVHGEALLQNQDMRAANCASCHGSHAAQPPTHVEVINVCGKCHTATQSLYEESLHARIGDASPQCWTCHGTHDVVKPDEELFFRTEPIQGEDQHCGSCHVDDEAFRMEKSRFSRQEDRRCDNCHHENSMIMAQVSSLHTNLSEASHAYEAADEAILEAKNLGMIVDEAENKLAEARTSLIRARASLHTTKLPVVSELTDETKLLGEEALQMAEDRLSENLFRRQAMAVAIVAIMLNVGVVYSFKRHYDKQSH